MDVFSLSGDLSHLLAMVILLARMWTTRSVSGLSGQTQFLYVLSFTTRFIDILPSLASPATFLKVPFLVTAYVTLYFVFFKFRSTYDSGNDEVRAEFLIIPVAGLSLLIHHRLTLLEINASFSMFLEATALIPQLYMISKTGEAETITSYYLLALGGYRALYTVHWIYRFYTEYDYDMIGIAAGLVQTAFYLDLLYLYITKVRRKVVQSTTVGV